jgi:hypothetical protein
MAHTVMADAAAGTETRSEASAARRVIEDPSSSICGMEARCCTRIGAAMGAKAEAEPISAAATMHCLAIGIYRKTRSRSATKLIPPERQSSTVVSEENDF